MLAAIKARDGSTGLRAKVGRLKDPARKKVMELRKVLRQPTGAADSTPSVNQIFGFLFLLGRLGKINKSRIDGHEAV